MKAIALVLAAFCTLALAEVSEATDIRTDSARPILLPTPKKVTWMDGRVSLTTRNNNKVCIINAAASDCAVQTGISQLQERVHSLGGASIPTAKDAEAAGTILWVGTRHELLAHASLLGAGFALPGEMCVPDGYVLRCAKVGRRDVIICAGYDARGCYYGLQTLIQLMSADSGTVSLPRVDIIDWPSFTIRLVKAAPCSDTEANVALWAEMLPRFKMNVLASQYQPSVDKGTWRKPTQKYQTNTEAIGSAGKTTDTFDPLLYLSPFGKNRGSLLDPQLIRDYIAVLEARISQGYKWIVVDFNDWGTYKVLSPEEKAQFKDVGEVMIYLTNEVYKTIRAKHPEVGIMSVPVVGYYGGLPKPELIAYCKAIPKDILIMTTGPVTRSTNITAEWLKKWTAATGRKPFLWDNTIYCHLDQYMRLINGYYNLNAFEVSFPTNMPKLLAGPGIHLNGGARKWWGPGVLTFLDYMWNPEAYDPKTSLRNAQILLWGNEAPDAANEAQRKTVELCDYLFKAYSKKETGSREEARAKLAELEAAVKRLASIIGDPVTASELDSDYLGKARATLNKVYPDPSAAQAISTKPVL